jgi:hypothetical protein
MIKLSLLFKYCPSRKFILRKNGEVKFQEFDFQESLEGKRIIIQVTAVAVI